MKRHPLRLRTKVSLYFMALLVLWVILLAVILEYVVKRQSYRVFQEGGAQLVRALAAECTPLVHYEDQAAVDRLVQRYRDSHPDIIYIVVQDIGGGVFWSTFPEGVPRELLGHFVTEQESRDVFVRTIRDKAGEELLYDYEYEMSGVCVRLGLSQAPVEQFIENTITYVAWIGLAGLLGVLLIAHLVSRPIERLSRSIDRLVLLEEQTAGPGPKQPRTRETEALADRFHQLVEHLEERTRQLDSTKKLAYLGEITTGIAHEVNNPLGVIVMNCGFLAKRREANELSPGAAEEVDRLTTAAKRATMAVQRLLQFARHSTQKVPPRYGSVRLDTLVRETLSLLQDRVHVKGCRVCVELPTPSPVVSCDENGLQQVLYNLLTNALDAVPDEKQIAVGASVMDGILSIQVSDQGPGMSQDVLNRAREPFFTTKGVERGTGLGLAISDRIVRAHGGELLLESEPGKGTTATIRIPLRRPRKARPTADSNAQDEPS